MSFGRTAFFLTVLICLGGTSGAQVPEQFTPFTAGLQFNITGASGSSTDLKGKLYVSGGAMRMEMATPQGQSITITDFAHKIAYTLIPAERMYIEHPIEISRRRRPPGWADLKPLTDPANPCSGEQGTRCKKLGVEEINGRVCDHWQLTERNGVTSEIWIDQKIHFPARVTKQQATWQLSDIREENPGPDLFQVPGDYHKLGTPATPPSGLPSK